jgi:hypothetical protein
LRSPGVLSHAAAWLCLFALATAASAEEPKGFLEWPWGTPMAAMNKEDLWCRGYMTVTIKKMTCLDHRIGDLPVSTLALYFRPDGTLTGYSMVFSSDGRLRDVIIEKFGPPTKTRPQPAERGTTGEILEWRWRSGTVAGLIDLCLTPRESCLAVSTKTLEDFLRRDEDEKKQQRKKDF